MKKEIGEKYLPIGTVVLLEGGTKRIMITGYCAIADSEQEKVWDYSGCLFPEGFLNSKRTCLFDHKQIKKVCYLGLIDDEEKKFQIQLKELVAKLNTQQN